jgi:hypothetical protein
VFDKHFPPAPFSVKDKPLPLDSTLRLCSYYRYVNRQTQHNKLNLLVLDSALLHFSAVHISHRQAGINSQKKIKTGDLSQQTGVQNCYKIFTTIIP